MYNFCNFKQLLFLSHYDKINKIFYNPKQDTDKLVKVIYKTALKTILCLILLAAVAFGVMSLAFPAAMGGMCEATGNYSMAAGYYSQSYKYTGDIEDIARCSHNCIAAGNDGNIIVFCRKYVEDKQFEAYVKGIPGEKQFIYGSLSCATYRQGEHSQAFELAKKAMEGVTGFPRANAYTALSLEVIKAGDGQTARDILEQLEKITPADTPAEPDQTRSYNALKSELRKISV